MTRIENTIMLLGDAKNKKMSRALSRRCDVGARTALRQDACLELGTLLASGPNYRRQAARRRRRFSSLDRCPLGPV